MFVSIPRKIAAKKHNRDDKKKCQNFLVKEKLDILKRLDDEGCSVSKIAREYGLADTTLRRWKRKRKEFEEFGNESTNTNNKRIKTPANSPLNEAIYIWFCQNRKRGIPLSGPILKAKAIELNQQLGENGSKNFSASDGWLSNWKLKYGVRNLATVPRDRLSCADKSAIEDFWMKFAELEIGHENLNRSQIFSCGEASLKYRLMPDKSFFIKEECGVTSKELTKNNIHLNVMACSNADGSLKLPLMVIGRTAQPASLKNMRKEFLPVYYTSEKNSAMNSSTFATWFTDQFVPSVTEFLQERCLPLKAVLLLENSKSHLSSENLSVGQIKAIFLPPNVTSIIRPMDQGILQNLRMRYKLKLSKSVLNAQDDGIDMNTHLNSITVRDVIHWISAAWNEVSEDTIQDCCKELLTETDQVKNEDPLAQIDENFVIILNVLRRIYGYQNTKVEDVKNWITNEASEALQELTDAQIVQMVLNTANHGIDQDDENENSFQEPDVTAKDALQSIECAIRFFEQHGIVSLEDMSVFLRAKDKLLTEKIDIL